MGNVKNIVMEIQELYESDYSLQQIATLTNTTLEFVIQCIAEHERNRY